MHLFKMKITIKNNENYKNELKLERKKYKCHSAKLLFILKVGFSFSMLFFLLNTLFCYKWNIYFMFRNSSRSYQKACGLPVGSVLLSSSRRLYWGAAPLWWSSSLSWWSGWERLYTHKYYPRHPHRCPSQDTQQEACDHTECPDHHCET